MENTNTLPDGVDASFWFEVGVHNRKVSAKEAQKHISPETWKDLLDQLGEGDYSKRDIVKFVFSFGPITYFNDRYVEDEGEGTLGEPDDDDNTNYLQAYSVERDELYYFQGERGALGPWMLYNY
jgi:hypothetical protein